MFLENETWELCPVKSNFNIAQLHVSKNHITEARKWSAVAFIYSTLSLIAHPQHCEICIKIWTAGDPPQWFLCVYMGVCVCVCLCQPVCQHWRGELHCSLCNAEEDKTAAVPCGVYVRGLYFPHSWATVKTLNISLCSQHVQLTSPRSRNDKWEERDARKINGVNSVRFFIFIHLVFPFMSALLRHILQQTHCHENCICLQYCMVNRQCTLKPGWR